MTAAGRPRRWARVMSAVSGDGRRRRNGTDGDGRERDASAVRSTVAGRGARQRRGSRVRGRPACPYSPRGAGPVGFS